MENFLYGLSKLIITLIILAFVITVGVPVLLYLYWFIFINQIANIGVIFTLILVSPFFLLFLWFKITLSVTQKQEEVIIKKQERKQKDQKISF